MKIDLQSFYVWHPDVCSQVPEELSGHFLVISQQIQSSALQSTYQVVKRTNSAEERAAIAKGGGLEAARSRRGSKCRVCSAELYVSSLCSWTRPGQASVLEIALVFAGESHALQSTLPAGRTILSTLQPLCMMGRSEKPVYPELNSGKPCQILKFGAIRLQIQPIKKNRH